VELAEAGEQGLHESLQGLYPDLRRAFAEYMGAHYPQWLRTLDCDRPPLSVDMVAELLVPVLARARRVVFVVVDCLRLDQWAVLAPLLAAEFDVEVTHYFGILPTATPYARNALFSGLFPAELAERHPDWWGDRDDESLNAHERELLVAQLAELGHPVPVRYVKVNTAADADELSRRLPGAIAGDGVHAFVFNFVDQLIHGRAESSVLAEVARDEVALRALTRQWFERSALRALLTEAARRGVPVVVTSDHGALRCDTPATVFARRDATANLRYKFAEDLRAERPEQALLFTDPAALRLPPRPAGYNTLLAAGDSFFVYPTRLREYQARYRGTFLHGGVTPVTMLRIADGTLVLTDAGIATAAGQSDLSDVDPPEAMISPTIDSKVASPTVSKVVVPPDAVTSPTVVSKVALPAKLDDPPAAVTVPTVDVKVAVPAKDVDPPAAVTVPTEVAKVAVPVKPFGPMNYMIVAVMLVVREDRSQRHQTQQ
jgi:hypothetical protein